MRCRASPICRQRPTRESRSWSSTSIARAAARYGLNADDILDVVQAGIGGETVSTLIEGTRRFDIAVRLAEEYPQQSGGHRRDPDPHR